MRSTSLVIPMVAVSFLFVMPAVGDEKTFDGLDFKVDFECRIESIVSRDHLQLIATNDGVRGNAPTCNATCTATGKSGRILKVEMKDQHLGNGTRIGETSDRWPEEKPLTDEKISDLLCTRPANTGAASNDDSTVRNATVNGVELVCNIYGSRSASYEIKATNGSASARECSAKCTVTKSNGGTESNTGKSTVPSGRTIMLGTWNATDRNGPPLKDAKLSEESCK